MKLLSTFYKSSVSSIFNMISGLVINKIISVYLGPIGYALIGQFRDFSVLSVSLGGLALNTGITKYISDKNYKSEIANIIGTAIITTFFSTLLISFLIIFFNNKLSFYLFSDSKFNWLFFVFGAVIIFFVWNQLLLSILNGLKLTNLWFSLTIAQSTYTIISSTLLIYYFRLDGALIAIATNQILVFLVSIFFLKIKYKHQLKIKFKTPILKKLLRYSLSTLFAILVTPLTFILIRDFLNTNANGTQTGLWQSLMYISTALTVLFATITKTYFLPKFSEISNIKSIQTEIKHGLILYSSLFFFGIIFFILFDEIIIELLFSDEFLVLSKIVTIQLIGDFFRILCAIFSILLIAKEKNLKTIFINVFFSFSFLFLIMLFFPSLGLKGTAIAYLINNLVCLVFTAIISRKLWVKHNN